MNRTLNSALAIALLSFLFSWAISFALPPVPTAKPHSQCFAKELQRKDCELTIKPYRVQVSRVKVTWSDGTWTSIADAPLPDEKFQWEKVTLQKIDGRWILQFWIWDDGKGEAKVQSLHWVVVELKEKQLVASTDQIVRKRVVRATEPVSYTYDREIPHSLKKIKGGLQWTVGKNAGTI